MWLMPLFGYLVWGSHSWLDLEFLLLPSLPTSTGTVDLQHGAQLSLPFLEEFENSHHYVSESMILINLVNLQGSCSNLLRRFYRSWPRVDYPLLCAPLTLWSFSPEGTPGHGENHAGVLVCQRGGPPDSPTREEDHFSAVCQGRLQSLTARSGKRTLVAASVCVSGFVWMFLLLFFCRVVFHFYLNDDSRQCLSVPKAAPKEKSKVKLGQVSTFPIFTLPFVLFLKVTHSFCFI